MLSCELTEAFVANGSKRLHFENSRRRVRPAVNTTLGSFFEDKKHKVLIRNTCKTAEAGEQTLIYLNVGSIKALR